MKYRLYNLVFLFISSWIFCQNNPHISLSKVTPDGGIAYSQVTSIIENSKGVMWFGTNNGLFSYNAVRIEKYSYLEKDSSTISTNRINSLFNDHAGNLWVATEKGLCSYNFRNDNFTRHKIRDQLNEEIGQDIISFFQDENNTYWLSDKKGFGTYNPEIKSLTYQNVNKKTTIVNYLTIGPDQTVWVFYEDGDIYFKTKDSDQFRFFKKSFRDGISSVLIDNNVMWLGYGTKGLLSLNLSDGTTAKYFDPDLAKIDAFTGYQIRSLIKNDNNIWAATDKGVALVNNSELKLLIDQQKHPNLPHNSIWSLYKDSNANIWIGTWLGGVSFHSEYNNSFQHHTQSTSKESLSSNIISCFAQIPNSSEILVGTDVDDLNRYNPETNDFTSYPVIYKGETIKKIKSITYDRFGTLWVGTYKNGLLFKKARQNTYERLELPFEEGLQALNILATQEGIWVSNFPLGVYFYNFQSKTFTNFTHNPIDHNSISNNNVNHIIEDINNNIWFATENGLNLLRKGTSKFIRYNNIKNNPNSISHNFINHIHEDEKGLLWLGSNGEGISRFNPITGDIENFTLENDGYGNEIFSILQDQKQNLWIATDNGLYKFNVLSNTIEHFDSNRGIKNNNFYPTAALKSDNGELYFGGSNGLIRFQPDMIIPNPIPPITTITQLYVNNKNVVPSNENSILKEAISNTTSLKLKYQQNSFSLKFIANNYIHPEKNNYKYRLKNFEEKWIATKNRGQASYTNIPIGNYIFEVKASNNNGIWNETPTRISIQITPPLWLTWYAYLFYVLIFITASYIYIKQTVNKQKLKLKLRLAQIRNETEEKLHQMKLQFFTDISHEFRTPLTLINGPVNRLLKGNDKNTELSRKQLALIKNNTDRLLRLINQFLDFRRINQGNLKLSPINTDVISFCKNVFDCFEELATQQRFNYNFITESTSLKMDFDTDKIDKVLVNILSNAFKNTGDQGNITLKIKRNKKTELKDNWSNYSIGEELHSEFVEISITDSGLGISSENLPKIFERFFQIKYNKQVKASGTGIGLSLTTNYINIHNGQLLVSSLKGVGTTFYIYLPIHQPNTFNELPSAILDIKSFDYNSETNNYNAPEVKNDKIIDNQESLILIAEDNPDLLEFLEDSISNHFRIAKSKNGKEALSLAMSLHPDLIISDIIMPEMDGIELCKRIKQDIRTSHIPVVLLTALSTVQNKISGMQSGADAYVPKPFNEEFLISQIDNLLNSRKTLRSLFASKQEEWDEGVNILNIDKKLIEKAIHTVKNNISNYDFTVEDFAKSLNLSRTHLHRKLKSLTNQSATEFIRNIRLKHAIVLMKSGDYRINEIGFAVGFNSHNYFTKAFKRQYGKSPRDFVRDNFKK